MSSHDRPGAPIWTRPLELTPTEALLHELATRYETMIFAGHSDWVPAVGLEKMRINWRGNLVTALALAARLAHRVHLELDDREARAEGPAEEEAEEA